MVMTRVNQDWVSGFTAETPILMADGTLKPISEIKPGDVIASFDPDSGEPTVSTVSEVFCDVYDDSLEVDIDGQTMIVANSQLFYTPDMEFKSAVEAEMVVTTDGVKVIKFKRYKGGKVKFYDITVDETHSFIADGVLVHNKKGGTNSKKAGNTKKNNSKGNNKKKGGKKKNGKGKNKKDKFNKDKKEDDPTIEENDEVETDDDGESLIDEGSADDDQGVSGDTGFDAYEEEAAIYQAPRKTTNPVPKKTINELESAQKKRNSVCRALGKIKQNPMKADRTKFVKEIQEVIKDVNQAENSDPTKNQTDKMKGSTSRATEYKAILEDLKQLKNFVQKTDKFGKKKKKFIDGKCDEVQKGIKKVLNALAKTDNEDTVQTSDGPGPIKPVKPIKRPPSEDRNKVYANDPDYDYFNELPNRDDTGCTGYVQSIPGQPRAYVGNSRHDSGYTSGYNKSEVWYKHFDTKKGKFYYSKSSQNCL